MTPRIPHLTPRIPHILQAMSRFKDSLTLDALHRPQLMAFCQARHVTPPLYARPPRPASDASHASHLLRLPLQFMGLAAFGPDPLLRFRINATLRRLQQDDKDILWEGVDALTDTECRAALRARGIPFTGLSPEQMRSGLSEWVQLSMNKEVPMVMMMMSNMCTAPRLDSKPLPSIRVPQYTPSGDPSSHPPRRPSSRTTGTASRASVATSRRRTRRSPSRRGSASPRR